MGLWGGPLGGPPGPQPGAPLAWKHWPPNNGETAGGSPGFSSTRQNATGTSTVVTVEDWIAKARDTPRLTQLRGELRWKAYRWR